MDKPPDKKRVSYTDKGIIYFWTASIHDWQPLLEKNSYKQVILDSLGCLAANGLVDIFAFVIMPTHIHLIWRMNKKNGRESPQGSFLKYTAQQSRQMLLREEAAKLEKYKVNRTNKAHEFWQRDSMAIPLYTREVALQKLNYLHRNPVAKNWHLAPNPCAYEFSSASYYELNDRRYVLLKNLWEEM